jgi:hypothetical protein
MVGEGTVVATAQLTAHPMAPGEQRQSYWYDLTIACEHGETSALLISGKPQVSDAELLLTWTFQKIKHVAVCGHDCVHTLPAVPPTLKTE